MAAYFITGRTDGLGRTPAALQAERMAAYALSEPESGLAAFLHLAGALSAILKGQSTIWYPVQVRLSDLPSPKRQARSVPERNGYERLGRCAPQAAQSPER